MQPEDNRVALEAPTGLEWITTNQDVDTGTDMSASNPGFFVYNRVKGVNSYQYSVENSKGETVDEAGTYVPDSDTTTTRLVVNHFTWAPVPSDSYTVHVWSHTADEVHNKDSERIASEPWSYTAPEAQLPAPTGLTLDTATGRAQWDPVDDEYAFRYLVDFYFDDKSGQKVQAGGDYVYDALNGDVEKESSEIPRDVLQMVKNFRATTIYARVRTLSRDITVVRPSELSDYSAPVNIDDIAGAADIQPESASLRDIFVEPTTVDLKVGDEIKAKITFDPEYADDTAVVWSSDDPAVASVDNGIITAKQRGTTTVWVTAASDQNIRKSVIVNVSTHSSVVLASGKIPDVEWTLYEGGTLVVNVGNIHGVAKEVPWSAYLDKITTLDIERAEQFKNSSIFYNLSALTTVYLPSSLYINGRAGFFYNCPSLETIYIEDDGLYSSPGNNTLVGPGKIKKRRGELTPQGDADALWLGTKTAVEIPSGVTTIKARAYYGQSVPYVRLPSGVSSVEDGAFAGCRQLSFIVVDNANISIDENAFNGCINLKDVYFAGTQKQWKKIAGKCEALKDADIHFDASMPELGTITFETNGGSTVSKQMVIKGRTAASLPETYLEKQVQDGWYLDAALTQRFEEGVTEISGDITLYAKWREAKPITIVYYSGKRSDGTGDFAEVGRETILEKEFITVPVLEQIEGELELGGWYRDENFDTEYKPYIRASEDMNLYARWIEFPVQEAEAVISDEVTLSYELEYTNEVEYDGRKHVVGQLEGVTKAASTSSQNPDIVVRGFKVRLNGTVVTGIGIKKFTYSNNKLPSYDGVSNAPMYIYPVLQYNKNDEGLKEALNIYPNLKKTLNAMMKPSYNKKDEEWSYDPIAVEITRINLSADTEVYTRNQLKQDISLKEKDGVLVWNGGTPVKKTRKVGGETYILKVTVPGLYYQRVFDLSNGKKVVKKLSLRAGEWKLKYDNEDGGGYYYTTMKSTAFDYYYDDEIENGALRLNSDWGVWSFEDSSGNIVSKVKAGYFSGALPNF